MNKISTLFVTVLLLMIVSTSFSVAAEEGKYTSTMKVFRDSKAVQRFFNDCYGYAIFPVIGKAGWVVGGSYGKG